MKKLLHIQSSLFSEGGESSKLTSQFVSEWKKKWPDTNVVFRDLEREKLPHLNAEHITAYFTPVENRTTDQQSLVEISDQLIKELNHADVIVMGVPMYNFGIPSTLKSYFDHIARAGVTFKYTDKGSVGLLTGKKVYIFATRGGQYSGTQLDTQTDYLRNFLSFIGISDVEIVYAECLNMGEAAKEKSLREAQQRLESLILTSQ